jgi:hypothetical protein
MLAHCLERGVRHVGAGLSRFRLGQRPALLAEPGPANGEGQGRTLEHQGSEDRAEGEEHDDVAPWELRRQASAAARLTTPRMPVHDMTT